MAESEICGAICGGSWPAGQRMRMNFALTGFGGARITRNGETVWSQPNFHGVWADELRYLKRPKRARFAESMAREDPNQVWQIDIVDAFWDGTFERKGKNIWVPIRTGQGAA